MWRDRDNAPAGQEVACSLKGHIFLSSRQDKPTVSDIMYQGRGLGSRE